MYVSSSLLVEDVGKVVAKFIEFMFRNNLVPSKNVNLVGHSLG